MAKLQRHIVMVIPGLPFEGDTLTHKSLGGSESAAIYMARELVRAGDSVTVFSNTDKPGGYDGVHYLPLAQARDYVSNIPHDITIVQRLPEFFAAPTASKLNVLWCHDLALKRNEQTFKGALWNVDRVMVVSGCMKQQYKQVYGLPDELFYVTRNGVDFTMATSDVVRDRKKLMYCARPERGLDVLLEYIMPRLLREDPEITLHIAGYDNTVPQMQPFYDHCRVLAAQLGNRVTWLGALTKQALYAQYASAGVYVYPTPSPTSPEFAEVSCITAMECMLNGLPIVASDRGALGETLGAAGLLIGGQHGTTVYYDAFAEAVLALVRNDVSYNWHAARGLQRVKSFDWTLIANEWQRDFTAMVIARNDDKRRMALDLWKHSDIVALKQLGLEHCPPRVREIVERDFAFMEAENGYRTQYETIGMTHDARVFPHVQTESRLKLLTQFLADRPEAEKILDYGCAHGSYSIHLSNALGAARKIDGVDIDKHSVVMAQSFQSDPEKCKHPDSLRFSAEIPGDYYDCVIAQEVLEHVPAPWELVDELESRAVVGAWVYITVPFGPWEYDSYETYPHRCHIWHFDQHDLRDMFHDKQELTIGAIMAGRSSRLNEPLGWWVVAYRTSNAPTHEIDMTRKLSWQRPRQTVSLNFIAGPGAEKQVLWMLDSARDVADEVICVDTGLSADARMLLRGRVDKVIDGPDPRQHGFETPRNIGLAGCAMDWVLWLDTDECLTDPLNLRKYLRENTYHGYGIRQHHFAVDTTFTPDMPVRLFRRRPTPNGKALKWHGFVHEHPESGINEGPGNVIVLGDVNIAHTGYLAESGRRQRFMRNFPMLQRDVQEYPDRVLQKHFVMRDNVQLCYYELQENGGVITPAIVARCNETIGLYRQYFLGKNIYMAVDSMHWYSEANKMLGHGFDVSVSLSADRLQAKPEAPRNVRYASAEDFEADMRARTNALSAQFTQEYA